MELRRSLSDLLAKARQRSFQLLLLDQLTWAAAIVFGGGVVILLAGTEYLSGFWLVLLGLVAVGAALYIALRKRPSAYGIAQRIDTKLKLADTLSTATYFEAAPDAADAGIRESQRLQAEHLAESVDLKRALPLARPRALYPAVGLALAVAAVVLLRYTALGSFNPRTSLVASAYDNVFGPSKQQPKVAGSPEGGEQPGSGREEAKDNSKDSDFAGDPSETFDPAAPEKPKEQEKQREAVGKNKEPDGGDEKSDSAEKGAPPADQKQGDKPSDGSESAKASESEPSLLSKMRDALSDMLKKMKSPPSDSGKGQKTDPNGEQQQAQDGQSQEKSEGQQGQDGKKSNAAQNGNGDSQKTSEDTKNGIGSSDGEKATKQAEALKAMGKITELLGKRAASIKGAVMVEVGSTKQSLKTPVADSQSTHAEAGSEIHRDEVPPMYQEFVEGYFDQIRKPSQTPPASPQTTVKQ